MSAIKSSLLPTNGMDLSKLQLTPLHVDQRQGAHTLNDTTQKNPTYPLYFSPSPFTVGVWHFRWPIRKQMGIPQHNNRAWYSEDIAINGCGHVILMRTQGFIVLKV